MIEYSLSTEWTNLMAILQMFFAFSLLLICHAGKCSVVRSLVRSVEAYFYSFSPVALLFYILYKIYYMN